MIVIMSGWVIAETITSLPAGQASTCSSRSQAERTDRQTRPVLGQASGLQRRRLERAAGREPAPWRAADEDVRPRPRSSRCRG